MQIAIGVVLGVVFLYIGSTHFPPTRPILQIPLHESHVQITQCLPLTTPSPSPHTPHPFLAAGSALVKLRPNVYAVFPDDARQALELHLSISPSPASTSTSPSPSRSGDMEMELERAEWIDLHSLPHQEGKHDLEAAVDIPAQALLPSFVHLGSGLDKSVGASDVLPMSHPDHAKHSHVLVFASGSIPKERDIVVLLHLDNDGEHGDRGVGTPAVAVESESMRYEDLYATLRGEQGLDVDELNIEGAALVLPRSHQMCRIFLLHRGNSGPSGPGSVSGGLASFACSSLLAHLGEPETHGVPQFHTLIDLQLGDLDGIPLTPTDVARGPPLCRHALVNGSIQAMPGVGETCDSRLVFLATAEDTPSPLEDGPVVGGTLGVLAVEAASGSPVSGSAGMARIMGVDGTPDTTKYEGVVLLSPSSALLVSDPDSKTTPASLCLATLPPSLSQLLMCERPSRQRWE